MRVRYHPQATNWLKQLAQEDDEVFGEIMALIKALEVSGHQLDDTDVSHPVWSSSQEMHALRRVPATQITPFATDPPVVRVLYTFCLQAGEEFALITLGGRKDEFEEQKRWYQRYVPEAENRARQFCRSLQGARVKLKNH